MFLILRIQVPAVSATDSPPTSWIDFYTGESVNRIIVKGIWRPSCYIHCRTHFTDKLQVLVDRKVKSNACQDLIWPVKQNGPTHSLALGITIQDVAQIGRDIYMLTQPAVDKPNQAKVANSCSRTSAALHLVKSGEIVCFVRIPSIEWNKPNAQSGIWTSQTNLGPNHEVCETGLTVEPVNERCVG